MTASPYYSSLAELKDPSLRSGLQPRLVIHGGAGNITHKNLSAEAYEAYTSSLREVLVKTYPLLKDGSDAIDAACEAVRLLENNPLFNAGKGAVFTRAGTNELEASVMVSRGKQKRATGVMLLTRIKNPILLAKEMLLKGEEDGGGGAQGHCQLSGPNVEILAQKWELEMVEPQYFYTQKRWDEHLRGLRSSQSSDTASPFAPETEEYLPQGTVGCVAMDKNGLLCVATSTGGLTNKIPGRIGDTPTIGAGFWAEEWEQSASRPYHQSYFPCIRPSMSSLEGLIPDAMRTLVADCLPASSRLFYGSLATSLGNTFSSPIQMSHTRLQAVALSGTGNGDSFLRLSAARTAAAIARFSSNPNRSLASAVSQVAGPNGELQESAGDRWGRTGDGQGGIIGIELVHGEGFVVMDFNCGGMFRGFIDPDGTPKVAVFKDDLQ